MKIAEIDINDNLWSKLRKCQRGGIATILKYIEIESPTQKSCLICLPTGAGKTGIIATVSHFCTLKKS